MSVCKQKKCGAWLRVFCSICWRHSWRHPTPIKVKYSIYKSIFCWFFRSSLFAPPLPYLLFLCSIFVCFSFPPLILPSALRSSYPSAYLGVIHLLYISIDFCSKCWYILFYFIFASCIVSVRFLLFFILLYPFFASPFLPLLISFLSLISSPLLSFFQPACLSLCHQTPIFFSVYFVKQILSLSSSPHIFHPCRQPSPFLHISLSF